MGEVQDGLQQAAPTDNDKPETAEPYQNIFARNRAERDAAGPSQIDQTDTAPEPYQNVFARNRAERDVAKSGDATTQSE